MTTGRFNILQYKLYCNFFNDFLVKHTEHAVNISQMINQFIESISPIFERTSTYIFDDILN